MIEGMVPRRRGRGWPTWRCTQDVEDNLGMRVYNVGELATSQESSGQAVKTVTFCWGPVR